MFPGDPNSGGANRKAIVNSAENSLRRLRADYLDLYWMHAWDSTTPIEETLRALDNLVTSGNVRYIGFSDTPAWKCAEARTIAELRGLAPVVALQIEYSLLERTVEGGLVPMARELGLGITPWSPLKNGVLSGKYPRQNRGAQKADRGVLAEGALTDKAYDIIDALAAIAREESTTPAGVALAWLAQKPGVTSIILGARRLDQLDDNLAAADVALGSEQIKKLDELSKPVAQRGPRPQKLALRRRDLNGERTASVLTIRATAIAHPIIRARTSTSSRSSSSISGPVLAARSSCPPPSRAAKLAALRKTRGRGGADVAWSRA
jgi:aryl-alcohol dehydrogenase-like predicted oxidoreductase